MKSPVSWVGNKTALLPYINAILPERCPRFIDVFGGSGTVLLSRRTHPGDFEVYNDYDGELVNLFRCMKEKTLAFIRELGFLPLNSREEFNILKRFIRGEAFSAEELTDELVLTERFLPLPEAEEIRELISEKKEQCDVRRAVAFLKVIRYSYSSGLKSFSCQPLDIRKLFILIWELSERMANTVIENQDFGVLIRHYDREDTTFYCDPPYYETEGMYAACFQKEDHHRLFETLSKIKGRFLLSYNDCPYIREMYKDFCMMDFRRLHNMAQKYRAGEEYQELLIGNFDFLEAQRKRPIQLRLYEDVMEIEERLREGVVYAK